MVAFPEVFLKRMPGEFFEVTVWAESMKIISRILLYGLPGEIPDVNISEGTCSFPE
jgi:hypothetical protein